MDQTLQAEYDNLNKITADYDDYEFDRRMRHYMMRTLEPFMREGKALEMGCMYGEFTTILSKRFEDLTVVDAAEEFLSITRGRVGDKVKFINGLFETFESDEKYDAIFIMHVLEHLINPVEIMARVKNFLTPTGRLYLIVPNANAGSRQIAVKMGFLTHNAALTPADVKHGHRITYSLDTLEKDVLEAGLSVVHRGGIFFKGLANFQLDKALEAGIIDDKYMEGCYQLGMVYPDLCSSVYVVAENKA